MKIAATGSRAPLTNDFRALREYDAKVHSFLQSVIARYSLAGSAKFTVDDLQAGRSENIIHTHRVNDIRAINTFFQSINRKLVPGGKFIGCFESREQRKERIISELPPFVGYPIYYGPDMIWKRAVPRVPMLKKIHHVLTGRVDRVLSTTEVLGRLASCGFTIHCYEEIGGLTYFYAEKTGFPKSAGNPAYRSIVKLSRIGRGGTFKKYYKLRTMYPYSEYLQEYVYKNNGIPDGDKPRDDFRVTRWGAFLRRYWLDELPMLINFFKGDLKLVGVRPISNQKFKTYPEWLQKKRIKYKPGLIPPFYVDMPETVEEFAETESRYLDLYEKSPFKTDVKYFFKALYNIIFKGARSR